MGGSSLKRALAWHSSRQGLASDSRKCLGGMEFVTLPPQPSQESRDGLHLAGRKLYKRPSSSVMCMWRLGLQEEKEAKGEKYKVRTQKKRLEQSHLHGRMQDVKLTGPPSLC